MRHRRIAGLFLDSRSAESLGSEPPECSIAELWRCWIVAHRAAKLPECEAAARRVERPAPGAVSSGRDADAPSRLHCRGTSAPQAFSQAEEIPSGLFPAGFAPIPNPFPAGFAPIPNPFPAGFAPIPTRSRRIRALHNPLPGLIHTPPEPFPPPGTPAARLRNPASPERQSRRACDSAGESPGQRCKGGVKQGIPTGEARSRRGIGPYGTVSAGAGPTARQPAKTGRRTRRTTPTRGLPTGTEETTRQRRSGSRPLRRQLVDKMSKDVETRR